MGKYRYFRGQRNASWKVVSSFGRLDEEGRQKARKQISDFYGFVRGSPELLPYLQNEDSIIATAQHHGIAATTFIDFSDDPEVAGWFASDGAILGQSGCIFMVDTAAEETFRAAKDDVYIIRFLRVDLQNLWMLQAQQG
jgi:hypothetical protein